MFWPMTAAPARDSTGAVVDDTLAPALAAGGRLSTLVRSGANAPATWVVDPALLDDAASLDAPASDQWLSAFGAGPPTARWWRCRTAIRTLPLSHRQEDPAFSGRAKLKGDRVYERLVGSTARSDLSWPADGAGDEQVIATSGRAGDSLVLLNEETAPLVTLLPYTPSGRIAWDDPELDILLSDESASALVATPADTVTDVLLARQRFLAETLLHALELPSDPRLLVDRPPRRWDPSPPWADEWSRAIRRANWLNPVSLDEAVRPSAPTVSAGCANDSQHFARPPASGRHGRRCATSPHRQPPTGRDPHPAAPAVRAHRRRTLHIREHCLARRPTGRRGVSGGDARPPFLAAEQSTHRLSGRDAG